MFTFSQFSERCISYYTADYVDFEIHFCPVRSFTFATGITLKVKELKKCNLRPYKMSSIGSGIEDSSGNGGLRSSVTELQNAVWNNQRLIEERIKAMEERLSEEQRRTSKLEESVRRALDAVLPKVEELLVRHQSSAAAAAQHSPETSLPVAHSTDNVNSPAGLSQQNLQHGLDAVGSENILHAGDQAGTSSTPSTPNECAPVTSGQSTETVTHAQSGASGSSASAAPSDPQAALQEAADAATVQRCLADGAEVDARDENGNTALHLAAANGRGDVVDALIASGSAVDKCGYRARSALHCAAARGHTTVVARLVTAGAKVCARDAYGARAAFLAAQGGHADVMFWLLEQGTPAATVDNLGRSLLMYAVGGGYKETDTHIFDKSDCGNPIDQKGRSPLFNAVKMQRRRMVKFLLQNGFSPIKVDMNLESPLSLSCKRGYGDLVGEMLKVASTNDVEHLKHCLIEAGSAEVVWSFMDGARDLVLGPAGQQALVNAARRGCQEVVKALLGARVNTNSSNGEALREASRGGHVACLVVLLDGGVYVNAVEQYAREYTALYCAASNGHTDCVQVLLQRGATPEKRALVDAAANSRLEVLKALLVGYGSRGEKAWREEALREAAKCGQRNCIVALLDDGVDVNAADSSYTALHYAAEADHAECLKELLQRGAKKEQLTEQALVNAAEKGRLEVLKTLLGMRMNTNASREDALREAAKNGRTDCVVELLVDGVNVNAANSFSYTALHYAALYGHAACVIELLQRGAKKELKGKNGETAHDLAVKK